MTEHSTAIKVDVFPDEFIPILKALKFAVRTDAFTEHSLSDESERQLLEGFIEAFSDITLNFAAGSNYLA
jgi:hypothetical protein